MGRYEKLFEKKKEFLEERLRIFQEVNTVWETLEMVHKKSKSQVMIENKYRLGLIS